MMSMLLLFYAGEIWNEAYAMAMAQGSAVLCVRRGGGGSTEDAEAEGITLLYGVRTLRCEMRGFSFSGQQRKKGKRHETFVREIS